MSGAGNVVQETGMLVGVAGALSGQPQIIATGLAGMAVGTAFDTAGAVMQTAAQAINSEQQGNSEPLAQEMTDEGVNQVLPPGVDANPAVRSTLNYLYNR